MLHELKCWPEYFQAIADGRKTFEVRKNDRNYQLNDTIRLREYNKETGIYTGRELYLRITYVLDNSFVKYGYCVMSVRRIPAVVNAGW